MAGKKGAVAQLQIEVNTEDEWQKLLAKEGLIVVDVYSDWCGPCVGMVGILRKIKLEIGGDLLILATAKSDAIEDLARFRNKSEPTWMFISGGQMVNLMFGANAPRLARLIIAELDTEKLAQAGEKRRVAMPFDQLTEEELIREEKKEAKRLEALAKEEAEKAAEQARRLEKRLSDVERSMTEYTVVALRPELFDEGRCEAMDALMAALSPDGYKVLQEALVDVDHPVLLQLMTGSSPEQRGPAAPEGEEEAVGKKKGLSTVAEEAAEDKEEVESKEESQAPPGETSEATENSEAEEQPAPAKIVLKLLKVDKPRQSEELDAPPSELADAEESTSEEVSATAEDVQPDALERVQQVVYMEMPLTEDEKKMGVDKISLLQKFGVPTTAEAPPLLWTPGTAREKASAILEFFAEAAAPHVTPEPEPLPPHVTLMFDTSKVKAVAALADEHSADVLGFGFFSSADPATARRLASSLRQYERLPARNGGETLVVVLNRTRSEPLLSFCLHTPFYISPNVEDGARLREAFFPPGTEDDDDEENGEPRDAEPPGAELSEESLLIPEDHELDPLPPDLSADQQ